MLKTAMLVAVLGAAVPLDAQVVPQRGRVSTEMDADSISSWSLRLGGGWTPVARGEAFDDLGTGFGLRGGVVARFDNGLGAGLSAGWSTMGDDLGDDRATVLEATVELLWTIQGEAFRVEAGPVVGIARLSRDILTRSPVGALGGAAARLWRPVGSRYEVGAAVDLLWAHYRELDFVDDLPRDPDQQASGLLSSVTVYLSIDLAR